MKNLRILVADDHQVLRDGLRLLISTQPDMEVVAEASNGEEALEKARALKPDLVIMDLSMPRMNGLKATEAIKAELPAIKVLVLTSYEDLSYFRHMCRLKASAYVLKRSGSEELLQAIRKVAGGQMHFNEGLAAQALTGECQPPDPAPNELPVRNLSERETEVLKGVALGYTNKEIADLLGLSIKTVETYKVRICEKLGFRGRSDMVKYAMHQGWLDQTHSFSEFPA